MFCQEHFLKVEHLIKRPQNLTDHQRIKLKDVLRYNLKSVRAYLFKEYFQHKKGVPPSDNLVALFREVLAGEGAQ